MYSGYQSKLCAQSPTSLGYAANSWYLQPASEVCLWATRAASPLGRQSLKYLEDYIPSGQPVVNDYCVVVKAQLPSFKMGTNYLVREYAPELPVRLEVG